MFFINDAVLKYENKLPLTSFALHIIAMAFMLCDHLWGTFIIKYDVLTYIGRLAFPIFAFMLAEGFAKTENRKKYALRLLVFALISEVPFDLMMGRELFNPFHQNVLFTFLLGVGLMALYDKIGRAKLVPLRILGYLLVTFLFYVLGFITFVDYYGYGILTVALFYFTRLPDNVSMARNIITKIIQVGAMYWINCSLAKGLMLTFSFMGMEFEFYKQGFAIGALIFIWLYNGKQGMYNKALKYTYYAFYPLHMAILGILITML